MPFCLTKAAGLMKTESGTDIGKKEMKGTIEKMGQVVNLIGEKFGLLTVVSRAQNNKWKKSMWNCLCECGKTTTVSANSLRSGETKSCGCATKLFISESKTKHGCAKRGQKERLFNVWVGMVQRCNNANQKEYSHYGGRGIKVYPEWLDYSAFREWAYANGYDENAPRGQCTIDRIDVNGNYEPANCRWVDMKTQRVNQRRMVTSDVL